MAARERRSKTARATRLIAIAAANAVCLFLLWKVAPAFGGEVHGEVAPEVASAPSPGVSPGLAAAELVDAPVRPPDAALTARIRAQIQVARERARTQSKGKVRPEDVHVAVHVRELFGAADLVTLDADRAMRPASNMKLVTTAAALVLLGPDWSFQTVLESDGPPMNGHVAGDLVVRAGGDPLYDPAGVGGVERLLAPAIGDLERAGLIAIDGALVLDEGGFQDPAPGPSWPADNQHWDEYCALAGGFSANAGCMTATVRPGTVGRAASVQVEPRHHGMTEKFAVVTRAAKQALEIRVEAKGDNVRVEGAIPRDVPQWSARFAAPDPVELFGTSLVGALAERKIFVRDGWRRERGRSLAAPYELARIRTPLADMLVPINTHSNNACADQLFLALGQATSGFGTRAGGGAATARALARLGVPTSELVQVDGSGLSRDNRVSARQITALVDAVLRLDARTARLFASSLATGNESGTLDDRMQRHGVAGRIHAKTGFIAGTSALSGIVDIEGGRPLVFSILVEYPSFDGLNTSCWKPMQDAICFELASWHD